MKKILLIFLITLFGCTKPTLQLKTVDAVAIHKQVTSHRGNEAVLINFWATWCAPCIEEFPMIVELSNAYKTKGMKIYFVSTDWLERKDDVFSFLSAQGVKGVSFLKEEGDDNDFIRAISDDWSGAQPFTIVYDKNGNVSDYWEMKKNRKVFETAILKAIGL
ncbi:MAG: TlpA disulfide reductase family protein [Candidatus Marinimicrobia bacterium]|nr:TlpA disulfide reductase family protein [Candidatus Neomarinimicrobiota bacterium]